MNSRSLNVSFQGIDGLDAVILFGLAAFLAAVNYYFALGLDPKTSGILICFSVFFLLEKRKKLFPKSAQTKIHPKRISLLGILGALFAVAGFIFCLLGFQNLMDASRPLSLNIPAEIINQEVKKQMEFETLQKEMELLASVKKIEEGQELPNNSEKLRWDSVKDDIKKEVEDRRVQLEKAAVERIHLEVIQSAENQKKIALQWAYYLIPLGGFLLLLGAFFERAVKRSFRIFFSSEINRP